MPKSVRRYRGAPLSTRPNQVICKENRAVGPTLENISIQLFVTTTILQYRQLVKRVFSVTAIVIQDTLQTTYFPLSDVEINKAPCPAQCR